VGYQVQGSVTYADDLTGAKIYVGSDIGSIYVLNATDGKSLSVFTAGGNVPCSPTIWEGKMYIGTTEGKLYCFDDSPTVDFNLYTTINKGGEMWNNETISIAGQLTSKPMMKEWDYTSLSYIDKASQYYPGLPNATVQISLTKPDGSNVQIEAATDKSGYFNISYNPTETGNWGWTAYYEGKRTTGETYNPAYTQWNTVNVIAAPLSPTQPTPVPTDSPTATPEVTQTPEETAVNNTMTYALVAIAVVIIIVVAIAAFMYTKRKKKPTA
jgi:hypothetical protein